MPASDAPVDAVQSKTHTLRALEKGAAVRHTVISCLESSLAIVQALNASKNWIILVHKVHPI
ncbi:hypothetical protein MEQU1_002017 [Malassezia equina]|uniref:Uncharacterized protein n=1 Tax=Malassezia equina TaxID=1381935 RepID=A0AAF0EFA3_9BASI|nr:hypothetical protein MEQU1_002017 [Malassezia equina]